MVNISTCNNFLMNSEITYWLLIAFYTFEVGAYYSLVSIQTVSKVAIIIPHCNQNLFFSELHTCSLCSHQRRQLIDVDRLAQRPPQLPSAMGLPELHRGVRRLPPRAGTHRPPPHGRGHHSLVRRRLRLPLQQPLAA